MLGRERCGANGLAVVNSLALAVRVEARIDIKSQDGQDRASSSRWNVERCIPRRVAAPFGPERTHLVFVMLARMHFIPTLVATLCPSGPVVVSMPETHERVRMVLIAN